MSSSRRRPANGPAAIKVVPAAADEVAGAAEPVGGIRPSTGQIIAEALPDLVEAEAAQRHRLQEALIACRAGADASRDARLRAAFSLFADELMTRGELREMFGLDLWAYLEYEQRFAQRQRDPIEF
jgi:hypothetical protein